MSVSGGLRRGHRTTNGGLSPLGPGRPGEAGKIHRRFKFLCSLSALGRTLLDKRRLERVTRRLDRAYNRLVVAQPFSRQQLGSHFLPAGELNWIPLNK